MNCPRCRTPLCLDSIEGLEIPVCPACRGKYLARGNLNLAAGSDSDFGDLEFSTVELDSFEHPDAYGPTACPQCTDQLMDKVEFNIYSGIILDYCKSCKGFWLDVRELRKVRQEVEELNAASLEVPEPPYLWFTRLIWNLVH